MPKYVYFISSENGKIVKIGKTIDIDKRFGELCRMSPYVLVKRADIWGYGNVERALHTRFASERLHGEWFSASSTLESVIRDINSVGRMWSELHYPTELRADGLNADGTGLRGRGRYIAQDRLFDRRRKVVHTWPLR